jgi:hypothetical protein
MQEPRDPTQIANAKLLSYKCSCVIFVIGEHSALTVEPRIGQFVAF